MNVIDYLSGIPHEAATFIAAMLPITELRGSIPVAITVWHIDPLTAFVLSVLGNIVPIFAILYWFDPIQAALSRRSKLAERFFTWLYARTRHKLSDHYRKYGPLALMIFVAIPLPMTGAWTGAIAAWLFAIPKRSAIIYVSLGTVIAGVIVTAVTMGARIVF